MFKVAEANYVAKAFYAVQDAVGARISLYQAVHFQVFIHPKRIERGGVKSGEEHIHHYEQINLTIFHAQRHIFIVVLEFLCRSVVARSKHFIIVGNAHIQEIAARLVESIGVF